MVAELDVNKERTIVRNNAPASFFASRMDVCPLVHSRYLR
jgi:hypothetical protein